MEFNFLEPVDDEILKFVSNLSSQQLGSKVVFHSLEDSPDLMKVQIALVGVLEERKDETLTDLKFVRKEFYSLFPGNWEASIADLGNILPGNTSKDTYFALQELVSELLKKNVIPIVIGGSQDLTYALYRAYDRLEQMVNLVSIDSKFDLGQESDKITPASYLTKIVLDEPCNLFNFCNIGYQTYFNSQEEIDLVEKLFFDAYRLGDISSNIALAEPVLRDADIVSLDLTSIQSSDSGNFHCFNPNGFSGREICTLARYAGLSDKVSVFGVFNHNDNEQESKIIAQIVWYFVEGFHYRSNEYPFGSKDNYLRYTIPLDNEELIFFKSHKSGRWWIEIPFLAKSNTKLKKSALLPCSYEEYLAACNQEIPDRWWKAQRRNIV
jgi:arginase family enzyme